MAPVSFFKAEKEKKEKVSVPCQSRVSPLTDPFPERQKSKFLSVLRLCSLCNRHLRPRIADGTIQQVVRSVYDTVAA